MNNFDETAREIKVSTRLIEGQKQFKLHCLLFLSLSFHLLLGKMNNLYLLCIYLLLANYKHFKGEKNKPIRLLQSISNILCYQYYVLKMLLCLIIDNFSNNKFKNSEINFTVRTLYVCIMKSPPICKMFYKLFIYLFLRNKMKSVYRIQNCFLFWYINFQIFFYFGLLVFKNPKLNNVGHYVFLLVN